MVAGFDVALLDSAATLVPQPDKVVLRLGYRFRVEVDSDPAGIAGGVEDVA